MSGTTLSAPPLKTVTTSESQSEPETVPVTADIVLITPDLARKLLKRNQTNRKLRDYHVKRLYRMIVGDRWYFNGDSIKIDHEGNLQDGQHRLTAIIEANIPVRCLLVTGIERRAFATIDTMRMPRSFGDVIHLKGGTKYSAQIGTALAWLIRYDRKMLAQHFLPENKIEHDEIERKFADCPKIEEAVERAMAAKKIVSPAMLGCTYYILTRAHQYELADRMIDTMVDPSRCSLDDPFYQLRSWLASKKVKGRHQALHILAIIFKACNLAYRGERKQVLMWKDSGTRAEQFPILEADTRQ
jgi:hypothetical protein